MFLSPHEVQFIVLLEMSLHFMKSCKNYMDLKCLELTALFIQTGSVWVL